MTNGIQFTAHCRDCDREISQMFPPNFENTNGLHIRCGVCGRTEWAKKRMSTGPQS